VLPLKGKRWTHPPRGSKAVSRLKEPGGLGGAALSAQKPDPQLDMTISMAIIPSSS
jgi:hypothetical protein